MTAAHLDYRIMKNGKYVNPLTELSKMPPGAPIDAASMPDFLHTRDVMVSALQSQLGSH